VNLTPDDGQGQVSPPGSGARPEADAWLARRSTIRLLWRVFGLMLALVVVAQFLFPVKGSFGVDGWPAFGAVFGFLSCLGMVLFAKALGWVVKRDENYYRGRDD